MSTGKPVSQALFEMLTTIYAAELSKMPTEDIRAICNAAPKASIASVLTNGALAVYLSTLKASLEKYILFDDGAFYNIVRCFGIDLSIWHFVAAVSSSTMQINVLLGIISNQRSLYPGPSNIAESTAVVVSTNTKNQTAPPPHVPTSSGQAKRPVPGNNRGTERIVERPSMEVVFKDVSSSRNSSARKPEYQQKEVTAPLASRPTALLNINKKRKAENLPQRVEEVQRQEFENIPAPFDFELGEDLSAELAQAIASDYNNGIANEGENANAGNVDAPHENCQMYEDPFNFNF